MALCGVVVNSLALRIVCWLSRVRCVATVCCCLLLFALCCLLFAVVVD